MTAATARTTCAGLPMLLAAGVMLAAGAAAQSTPPRGTPDPAADVAVEGAFDDDDGDASGAPPPRTAVEIDAARKGYSPYAGRSFPSKVYFGDTHNHTANSGDAFMGGNRLSPEQAYRFARGEEVVSSTGIPVKLSRPLDFLVIADHAEGLGIMYQVYEGNPSLMTDPTLVKEGTFYPLQARSAEARLRFYAENFPLVEVDSTYYFPPSERNAVLWIERTPPTFTFNIKAYSLLTNHPTKTDSLYKDLREELPEGLLAKRNLYREQLPDPVVEEVWTRFHDAVMPLHSAGKLGAASDVPRSSRAPDLPVNRDASLVNGGRAGSRHPKARARRGARDLGSPVIA